MEGFFNSKFMITLQKFGQALGRNKYLSALQATMQTLMAIIMVGAISQILCSVGCNIFGWFSADSEIYQVLYMPYNFTMNMLSLWVVLFLGYNYARNIDIKTPVITASECLFCYLLIAGALSTNEAGTVVMDTTYFSASGMFMGFLTCFIVAQIDKMCVDRKIYIRMPDIVPQFLQDGFAGIVPLLFNVIIFQVLNTTVTTLTGGAFTLISGFIALLAAPLAGLTSAPGIVVICTFAGVLWCFGIHGALIAMTTLMPIGIQTTAQNYAAFQSGGTAALVFYPVALAAGLSYCGGSGNTFPATIYAAFFAKSEQVKAVGKASIVPGWFNINEPMTFGLPIMYNPILCIPYILCIPLNCLFYWIGYATGLLIPGYIMISALLPMGFAGYLSTLNIWNFLWDYFSVIPMGLIWLPFIRAYDKQLYDKEQAELAAEASAEA